jgi:hypothetical protein
MDFSLEISIKGDEVRYIMSEASGVRLVEVNYYKTMDN